MSLKNRHKNKKLSPIKIGVLAGLFFALGLAGFDYVDAVSFSFKKFMFNFIFFGLSQAYITYLSVKHKP